MRDHAHNPGLPMTLANMRKNGVARALLNG